MHQLFVDLKVVPGFALSGCSYLSTIMLNMVSRKFVPSCVSFYNKTNCICGTKLPAVPVCCCSSCMRTYPLSKYFMVMFLLSRFHLKKQEKRYRC